MWLFNGEEFQGVSDPKEAYGFVYLITNLKTGRKYVGKKFLWSSKTKIVKKRRRKIKVESDWRNYYGSSTQLQKDVEELGKKNFKREILRLCANKASCAYYEMEEQVQRRVLFTEDYYNDYIGGRVRGSHIHD